VFSVTKCAVGIYLVCSSIFSNEAVQHDRFYVEKRNLVSLL